MEQNTFNQEDIASLLSQFNQINSKQAPKQELDPRTVPIPVEKPVNPATVMDQFNAIRQRINTTQPVDSLPPQTGDKQIKFNIKDPDTKQTMFVGFSTDGKPKTEKQFNVAYKQFDDTGKAPGFTFLAPDSFTERARTGFETVNQPVQGFVRDLASEPNKTSEELPFGDAEGGIALGNMIRKHALPAVAESVNTPEKLAGLAGQAAVTAATGGANLPIRMAVAGVGGAAGYLGGQLATGSTQGSPGALATGPALQAISSAVGEGAAGLFRHITNTTLSDKAQQGVLTKMNDYIKTKYGSLTNNPRDLNAIFSTESGANNFIQMGIKALRGDVDDLGKELAGGLIDQLPKDFPAIKQLRILTKEYIKTQNDILSSIGDDKALTTSRSALKSIEGQIQKLVVDNYNLPWGKASPGLIKIQQEKVVTALEKSQADAKRFEEGVELYNYMKKSVGKNGFDVRKFQENVMSVYKANPGSDLNEIGKIAGREADLSVTGPDKQLDWFANQTGGPRKLFGLPLPNRIPIGQRYVGSIPHVASDIVESLPASAASLKGINEFLGQGGYVSKDQRGK